MRGYLSGLRRTWEVLLIDDGSTDESPALLRWFVRGNTGFSLLSLPHGGKPAALWAGLRQARGEIVLFTDMDQSTPLSEWDRLAPWHERGYDAVIGSRGPRREGFPLLRRISARVFRQLRRLVLLRSISDTQCGFKSFRRLAALSVFPHLRFLRRRSRPAGWHVTAFDVELLFLLSRAGFSIREVEVEWRHRDRKESRPAGGRLSDYLRESLEMAEEVLHVRLKDLMGGYRHVGPWMREAVDPPGDPE